MGAKTCHRDGSSLSSATHNKNSWLAASTFHAHSSIRSQWDTGCETHHKRQPFSHGLRFCLVEWLAHGDRSLSLTTTRAHTHWSHSIINNVAINSSRLQTDNTFVNSCINHQHEELTFNLLTITG